MVVRAGARGAGPQTLADVPAVDAGIHGYGKELKRRGFRFVGPTTAYALMQATGMVDDHMRLLLGASTAEGPRAGRQAGSLHTEAAG